MTLSRVVGIADELGRTKRVAVGSECPPFPRERVGSKVVSFASAVTAIWTWYSERLRHDLHFLTPRGDYQQRTTLKAFSVLLDDQRHFNEHADYNRAREAQAWRDAIPTEGDGPSDGEMLNALLDELAAALETLRAIADSVRRDAAGLAAWRAHEARTTESEIRAILADIGRDALPQRRVDTVVRRFEGHPKLKFARTPQDRARIAAVVAMEMNLDPLTIPYDKILDEFGLIGDPLGVSLLLVAHGVEASGFTGARLLPVLRKAWREVHPGAA